MSIKSVSLSVALISAVVAPMAAQAVPANYAVGFVTAVDAAKGTMTIDGTTFAAKTTSLGDIMPGNEVDVAYVTVGGVKQAISIELIGAEEEVGLAD